MRVNLDISEGTLLKTFFVSNKKPAGLVTFCIDTGSSDSFIGFSDAIRLKLRISHLPKDPVPSYAGGGSSHLRILGKTKLEFIDHSGQRQVLLVPEMKVCDTTMLNKVNQKNRERMLYLDSILGTDFLNKTKASLFANFSKGVAYVDIP